MLSANNMYMTCQATVYMYNVCVCKTYTKAFMYMYVEIYVVYFYGGYKGCGNEHGLAVAKPGNHWKSQQKFPKKRCWNPHENGIKFGGTEGMDWLTQALYNYYFMKKVASHVQ
eukprot:scpid41702/ scgid21807/ 